MKPRRTCYWHHQDWACVETSPTNKVWGIGFNTEDAVKCESDWGENKLGKASMKVREQLAAH